MNYTSKFKLTFPLSNGVSFELKDPLFRSENLFKQGNFFVKHPVEKLKKDGFRWI